VSGRSRRQRQLRDGNTTGPIIQLGEVSTRTEVTGQIVLGPLVNLGTYHLDCQIPGIDAYFYFLLSSYVTEAS
jgi:hypothetical protein